MARKSGGVTVRWVRPPSTIADAIRKYGNERVQAAIFGVARLIAQRAENDMRMEAPWTDRTGVARSALFSTATRASKSAVIIYMSHGSAVEYGKFLELAHGGRYAIIMPTIERMIPEINRMLRGIFG